MESEIVEYLRKGYRIASRGEGWAQLWRPKAFSYWWFSLLFVLLLGFGGVLYGARYLARKEETVYLRAEPDGSIYGLEYMS